MLDGYIITDNIMAKYGPEHRAAREEKLASMPVQQCEVTGSKRDITAHHVVPKMFDGPDKSENYMILAKGFHDFLHAMSNVDNKNLVIERLNLSQVIKTNILNDLKVNEARTRIREIDNILMDEYVSNFIEKVGTHFSDAVKLTILSNFHTIRELAIENRQLKAKLSAYPLQT